VGERAVIEERGKRSDEDLDSWPETWVLSDHRKKKARQVRELSEADARKH